MIRTATFSEDGQYRYDLQREWATPGRQVLFVMLNPSTADTIQDDPTVRRCIGYAQHWGFNGLRVVNLYALRSTDPAALWTHPDPVGPGNKAALRDAIFAYSTRRVVAAWGCNADPDALAITTVEVACERRGLPLLCLGTTKAGAPKHPLYLPKTAELKEWSSC